MFGMFKNLFGSTDNTGLKEALEKGAFLVDVRTPAEFSGGTVKDAVNIPLDRIASKLDSFKNKKTIIVFCRSGNRSSQAKRILENNGFQNIINGGTWQNVNQFIK